MSIKFYYNNRIVGLKNPTTLKNDGLELISWLKSGNILKYNNKVINKIAQLSYIYYYESHVLKNNSEIFINQ